MTDRDTIDRATREAYRDYMDAVRSIQVEAAVILPGIRRALHASRTEEERENIAVILTHLEDVVDIDVGPVLTMGENNDD